MGLSTAEEDLSMQLRFDKKPNSFFSKYCMLLQHQTAVIQPLVRIREQLMELQLKRQQKMELNRYLYVLAIETEGEIHTITTFTWPVLRCLVTIYGQQVVWF